MSNSDEVKGRVKEAAGAITGDDEMKEEGKNDQREGKAKSKVDEVAGKVKDGIDSISDRLRGGS